MNKKEKYQCPNCGSKNTKKAEAIYQQGFQIKEQYIEQNSVGESTGIGAKQLSVSLESSKTSGKSFSKEYNLLVESCAPPREPRGGQLIVLFSLALLSVVFIFLISIIERYVIINFIFAVIIGYGCYWLLWFIFGKHISLQKREYYKKLENYKNTWVCLKCNHKWIEE